MSEAKAFSKSSILTTFTILIAFIIGAYQYITQGVVDSPIVFILLTITATAQIFSKTDETF